MIRTFKDKNTLQLYQTGECKKFPYDIHRRGLSKLILLKDAHNLSDLSVFSSNRLEKLYGDRAGQYSIRINKRWRICFYWIEQEAYDVEVVDYH